MHSVPSHAHSGMESTGPHAIKAPRTNRASPPRNAPIGANFASRDAMSPTVADPTRRSEQRSGHADRQRTVASVNPPPQSGVRNESASRRRSALSPRAPPDGGSGLRTGALELLSHGTPACVAEHPGVVPLAQISDDSPACRWRRQHRLHVIVERDVNLYVLRGDRAGRRSSALLGCCPAALRGTPTPRSPGRSRSNFQDRLATTRARPLALVLGGHFWCSSSTVHAITVDARQRRCLPTRKPAGPYPLVRQQ